MGSRGSARRSRRSSRPAGRRASRRGRGARAAPGERAIRLRPGDPVGSEAAPALVAAKRDARAPREPPVHSSRAEPVAPEAELEHRDVPAERSDAELALTEKRPAARPERPLRSATDETGRRGCLVPAGTRASASVVSWPRTPSTGPGSNPWARSPTWSAATRALAASPLGANTRTPMNTATPTTAKRRMPRIRRPARRPARSLPKPRLQSRGCLPR